MRWISLEQSVSLAGTLLNVSGQTFEQALESGVATGSHPLEAHRLRLACEIIEPRLFFQLIDAQSGTIRLAFEGNLLENQCRQGVLLLRRQFRQRRHGL